MHTPPNMAANEMGIKNFDGDKLYFCVHDLTKGIKIATMGVLFRNAEKREVGNNNRASFFFGFSGEFPNM